MNVEAGKRAHALRAVALFFAFTAPFGIVAHLAAEFFGLGWHDDADVFLSARHGYLAVLVLVAFAGFALAIRALPPGARRARVAALVESLPFRGTGFRFTALAFVAQFAFFAVTQIGEGCPLCAGDVVVGIFAATIAALCGAFAVSLGKRRVLAFVLAIVEAFVAAARDIVVRPANVRRTRPLAIAARTCAFSLRYRPPPQTA